MIKINLVSKNAKVSGAGMTSVSADGEFISEISDSEANRKCAVNLLIIALFPLALFVYESQTVPELKKQLNNQQQTLNQLQTVITAASKAVSEKKKFQEDESRLKKQIQVMEDLRNDRLIELRVFELLQKDIPFRTSIESLEVVEVKESVAAKKPAAGGRAAAPAPIVKKKIVMKGIAASNADIALFVNILSQSIYFSNVSLGASRKDKTPMGDVVSFEVTAFIGNSTKTGGSDGQ